MRIFQAYVCKAIFLLIVLSSMASAKELSLIEIREKLINQNVLIIRGRGGNEWYLGASDQASGYRKLNLHAFRSDASDAVLGKHGIVISVEQVESNRRASTVGDRDVFGKIVGETRVINPYIDVAVKLADEDVIIITRTYYSTLIDNCLRLASEAEVMKKEIENELSSKIGRTLYKTGFTELLDSTASLDELLNIDKRATLGDRKTKNLTALKIVEAKFLEGDNAIVISVILPDGDKKILFGKLDFYDFKNEKVLFKRTIFQKMDISAEEKIPAKFSSREISSIKAGEIFKGMSEDALYWSWGYPLKTNDYGSGGQQLIYKGGQYVYIKSKFVSNWQSMSN